MLDKRDLANILILLERGTWTMSGAEMREMAALMERVRVEHDADAPEEPQEAK